MGQCIKRLHNSNMLVCAHASPRLVLTSPRLVLTSPRLVLTSPRLVLTCINAAVCDAVSKLTWSTFLQSSGIHDHHCPNRHFFSPQIVSSVCAGNLLQLEAHVLHPHTLHLQAKWQLPCSCAAAAASPNGCALATIHQTTDQNLPCLHQSSQSIASQAVIESVKQKLAAQRPAEHEAVSQQPAEHQYGDPMAVDLTERQKVSMHPLSTRADNLHQPLADGAASNMPTIAFAHLEANKQQSGAGAVDTDEHPTEVVGCLQHAGTKTVDMPPWATETTVSFGVLLPEAKSLVQVAAQGSGRKTDEGYKAEEVQAQNDKRSNGIAAQVKHEQGQKMSSVRVTAAADGGGGLQWLSDALIDR